VDDNSLIKKCQQGDKEAFHLLISKYHPFVYKFLVKSTRNEQLAEDLTQDTFIKLVRSIDKFDIDGKAMFSTYIITIAKNSFIDYFRKEKRYNYIPMDETFDIQDMAVNVEDMVADKLYGQNVMANLEDLSEEQRIAIELKYIEGLTLKEIGEKLNVEPKTVKSRIHNGIVRLRKLIGKGDGNEGD
jgi:RNA polymerase sigma-70 factor (ECF subfamily)